MTESLTVPVSSSTTPSAAVEVSSGESSDDWGHKFSMTESLTAIEPDTIVISSAEEDEITISPNAEPETRTIKREKVL
jgi:hypothetical protein